MNQKIMPTEESQTQKNTFKMISVVWNFRTGKTEKTSRSVATAGFVNDYKMAQKNFGVMKMLYI